MFAVKVGDEVGTVWSSSHSYASASISKVTKINGHGHIYLSNGDVYDKHGDKRTLKINKSSSGSCMHLVPADAVRREKEALAENQRLRGIVSSINAKLAGLSGYSGRVHVTAEDKAELIALVNTL
jgi:hypothetical protein